MLTEPYGGAGTQLDFVSAPGANQSQLAAALTYMSGAAIAVGDVEQLTLLARVTSNAAATARIRVQWSSNGTSWFDEVVEAPGTLAAGVQPYACNIKEWGPLASDTVANGGRGYTLYRPVSAHFMRLGVQWSGAPAATDSCTLTLARQRGAQLQGPVT